MLILAPEWHQRSNASPDILIGVVVIVGQIVVRVVVGRVVGRVVGTMKIIDCYLDQVQTRRKKRSSVCFVVGRE